MKKTAFFAVLFAIITAWLFAQELPRLAVVEFTTNIDNEKNKAAAVAMRDLVESQMAGMKQYRIMTRGEIDTLIKNQQIQVSSIASSENIKKLSLANVNYVVTGSLNALGDDYSIIVRLLDVSSGEYPHSASDLVGSGSRDFVNGINTLLKTFVSGMTSDGDRVVQNRKNTLIGKWKAEGQPVEIEFFADNRFIMVNFIHHVRHLVLNSWNNYTAGEEVAYQGNINGTYSSTETELMIRGTYTGILKRFTYSDSDGRWISSIDTNNHSEEVVFSNSFKISEDGNSLILSEGGISGSERIIHRIKNKDEEKQKVIFNNFIRIKN